MIAQSCCANNRFCVKRELCRMLRNTNSSGPSFPKVGADVLAITSLSGDLIYVNMPKSAGVCLC